MSEVSYRLSLERARLGRISENLRGWNYSSPPIRPYVTGFDLPVSSLAYSKCDTLRDIYLRVCQKVSPPENDSMKLGLSLHKIFAYVIEVSKKVAFKEGVEDPAELYEAMMGEIKEGFGEIERDFFKKMSFRICWRAAEILERKSNYNLSDALLISLPSEIEKEIDGSMIGLSKRLRVDAIYQGIPIDLKLGSLKHSHKLSVAGYGLAIEASTGLSTDVGIIINVEIRGRKVELKDHVVYLSDDLRRDFLEKRDEALEIIAEGVDPGMPPSCPKDCIYLPYCMKGDEER